MDWAYISGFFDGEGCISIRAKKNSRPTLSMAQTDGDHSVLADIQEFLQIHKIRSYIYRYGGNRPANYKPARVLVITHAYGVEDFLTNCLPHLRVKRKKAELAIGFLQESNRVKKARDESVSLAAKEYIEGTGRLRELTIKYKVGEKRLIEKIKSLGFSIREKWDNGTVKNELGQFVHPVQ
jgi:LAGLIDADG-like domain